MDSSTDYFTLMIQLHANGGFHTYSDERYKTNITLIPNALNRIKQIRGVTFAWDRDQYPEKEFCLACSMVLLHKKLLRFFLKWLKRLMVYYTMQYSELIPVLIEATKELKKEKDNEINDLKTQLNDLMKRIEALESN